MYFAHIGDQLADDINSNESREPPANVHQSYPPTFNLVETNDTHVQELINNLNCSKSCGLDGLTARLIKDAGSKLTPIITYIFNLSIKQKRFPDIWKTALVSPIHKDGDKSEP